MPKPDNHLDLVVVVSGAVQNVRINVHERLEHAVREALRESGNEGQPPGEWELRSEAGELLDLEMTGEQARLQDGATLFLSPRAGAGG